jgi:metal-responsive CopG/Arc/MetJ family transcriptional regulator
MPQILVHLDDELVREIRKIVKEKYGSRRGSLSIVVEDALRRSLVPPEEISASTLLEVIDYVSKASKEGQPKDQILTNVFLMLDRQFEQSIIRGLEDAKKSGRTKTVPKGNDPVDFLRKLASETKK